MKIIDELGGDINTSITEIEEQSLVDLYIEKEDVVLELGGRCGIVSCLINSKLNNKSNHVVVEPDDRVWNSLAVNKSVNNCNFYIVQGFISRQKLNLTNKEACNGYASYAIKDNKTPIHCYTLEEIAYKSNIKSFNVLVADCEGCLEDFLNENVDLCSDLRLVIYEADGGCNYDYIEKLLIGSGLDHVVKGLFNVFIKL